MLVASRLGIASRSQVAYSQWKGNRNFSAAKAWGNVTTPANDVVTHGDVSPVPPSSAPNTSRQRGLLYISASFPIRLGIWDLRGLIAALRADEIIGEIEGILKTVKVNGFALRSIDKPMEKEGGLFVNFDYDAPDSKEDRLDALNHIENAVHERAEASRGLPTWIGIRRGDAWVVRGEPWHEDMHRYAAETLKVDFEGPDVHEEVLYQQFRRYGRIDDISRPVPVPAGALRYSLVRYQNMVHAVTAKNCLHGFVVSGKGSATRLSIACERKFKAQVITDWLSNHPRIVLPIVAFLLGTLTYTIFDPIRAWMVQAKVQDWFSYKDSRILKWIRRNTIERLSIDFSHTSGHSRGTRGAWEERKEAEKTILTYLADTPDRVTFLHGPPGSGKVTLVKRITADTHRPTLVIDCAPIIDASSDTAVIGQLATQTGYWPVFSFLNSLNNMFDLASQGLIGQKAGFSRTIDSQIDDVLNVVGSALTSVNDKHAENVAAWARHEKRAAERREAEAERKWKISHGVWHDGRLDCVAGVGLMSEVGIGDESLWDQEYASPESTDGTGITELGSRSKSSTNDPRWGADQEDVSGLPIVVLKNFDAKGANKREQVLDALAKWSAGLIEKKAAHVIVVSDNRESMKRVTRALGSRPLNTVSLNDADDRSALRFVSSRLEDSEDVHELTLEEQKQVTKLGGRSSDLEMLVNKVRNGQNVAEAVDDVIDRTLSELRKNAFGDDIEDSKILPWKREQAWIVVKRLAKESELSYADTVLDFPFKGDDVPLREMERADLVTILTNDGFPVTIKPGRPVYRYVFQRLVNDPVFAAIQEIATNEKLITSAEATVKACEDELTVLRTIGLEHGSSFFSGKGPTGKRAEALLRKMSDSQDKIQKLETENVKLKRKLVPRTKSS